VPSWRKKTRAQRRPRGLRPPPPRRGGLDPASRARPRRTRSPCPRS
jgi:hypothetical protein